MPHAYLNTEVRARLITALRSGRYRQITGRFDDGLGGRCVVGLATHLHLTAAFAPGEVHVLMELNDSGWTFAEIADRLERGDLVASYQPPPHWALKRIADLAAAEPGAEDDEPPPAPALIFVFPNPQRPWLDAAAEMPRRVFAAA